MSHDPSVVRGRDVSVWLCVCFVYSVVEYVHVVSIYCIVYCGEGADGVKSSAPRQRVPTRMTSHEPSIHDGTYARIDGS